MNEKLGKCVTEKPHLTLLIVLTVTFLLIAVSSMPSLFGLEKKETERETDWIPDNEVAKANQEIKDKYGIQAKYLIIIVQGRNDNVLSKEAMIDILNVEMKIAENPKVRELLFPQPGNISSLPSSLAIQMLGNPGASYQEMIDFFQNLNQSQLDGILMNAPPQVAKFLTKDFQENKEKGVIKAKGTLILVMLNATKYDEIKGDKNPILDGDEEILKIFDSTEFSGVKRMGLIEDEYVSKEIDEESGGVMGFLFMMVVFLIIGILFLTYKSVFDSIISLLALLFAIVWMNGIGVLLGLTFTTMSESVRIMLMGLGIDYGIHIVMRYREERLQHRKKIAESLVLTTASVGTALFLATLTTSLSFGSNMVSEIKPMREFAIFAVVGIFSAFIIMVTFVPASKQIYHSWQEKRDIKEFKKKATKDVEGLSAFTEKGKRGVPKGTDTVLTRILAKGAVAAEHHAKSVIVAVVVVSLLCTALSLQLETKFDFTEFLPENAQITDDITYMRDNFEFGTEEADVLIKGKIDEPDVLKAIAETENNIMDDPNVNKEEPIESILTLMYSVATEGSPLYNKSFAKMYNDSDANKDGIPEKNITNLFNFLSSHPSYLPMFVRVVHFNENRAQYEGAVIRVGVNSQSGAKNQEIYEDLKDDVKPLKDEEKIEKVVVTGGPVLVHVIIKSVERSGMQSLQLTVFVAAIILTIVFYLTDKSLILGILTEIPVILVIAWVFASMYLMGLSLNVLTITIASLTVGLGITYGIHISHRFVEDLKVYHDIDEACRSTVTNTGAALFGAAVTTIGGFGILYFAPIPPIKTFGAISALSIFFSLISSVFVLPTFLSLWAKYVKKKRPDIFKNHLTTKETGKENVESEKDEEETKPTSEESKKESTEEGKEEKDLG